MRSGILRVAIGVTVALAPVVVARASPPDAAARAAALTLADATDGSVEIRAGSVVVVRVALSTPALRRAPARLRELTVEGHHVVEVRVAVRGTPHEELWVGELGPRAARVLWSGLVGPRDADGETSLGVDVTPDGVLEYQTAGQVTRCDGLPARLFPRAFDFEAWRFRPVMSPLPPAAPQTLVGRRGDPSMPKGRPVAAWRFTSASTTGAAGSDARGLTAPVAVDDGDPATAWSEGLGGDGRGEFLSARASASASCSSRSARVTTSASTSSCPTRWPGSASRSGWRCPAPSPRRARRSSSPRSRPAPRHRRPGPTARRRSRSSRSSPISMGLTARSGSSARWRTRRTARRAGRRRRLADGAGPHRAGGARALGPARVPRRGAHAARARAQEPDRRRGAARRRLERERQGRAP